MYCQLGDYMLPIPPIKGTRKLHWHSPFGNEVPFTKTNVGIICEVPCFPVIASRLIECEGAQTIAIANQLSKSFGWRLGHEVWVQFLLGNLFEFCWNGSSEEDQLRCMHWQLHLSCNSEGLKVEFKTTTDQFFGCFFIKMARQRESWNFNHGGELPKGR